MLDAEQVGGKTGVSRLKFWAQYFTILKKIPKHCVQVYPRFIQILIISFAIRD